MFIIKNQNLINSLTKPDIKHLRQHQIGVFKHIFVQVFIQCKNLIFKIMRFFVTIYKCIRRFKITPGGTEETDKMLIRPKIPDKAFFFIFSF